MYCKICEEETEQIKARIILGDVNLMFNVKSHGILDLRYKTKISVCSECGVMTLVGFKNRFHKMLNDGYTEADMNLIDVDQILHEMETTPVIYPQSDEIKIWVDASIFHEKNYDTSNNQNHPDDLSKGFEFDKLNYYRLINFLLLDPKEREDCFGKCKCPIIEIVMNEPPYAMFIDGRRRFSLLHYLGAKKIPVAINKSQLEDLHMVEGLGNVLQNL